MSPIRVFLVDDHPIVRKGLRELLVEQRDIEVVGEAGNGQEALSAVSVLKPDVVVVDIALPDISGIEVLRSMERRIPAVILSVYDGRQFVAQALRAGALAYVLKESALHDLVAAVRAAAAGQRYLSPKLSPTAIEEYELSRAGRAAELDPYEALTPRERQVLHLVAEGLTTREISARLGISRKTVDTHRVNGMRKLDLHSAVEVTRYLQRRGLRP
ncbi:MAG: response regulator transcription factor [Anaerolineae bacterium]|nr:response regulator transcription factor [Anaerolineae bacterium]